MLKFEMAKGVFVFGFMIAASSLSIAAGLRCWRCNNAKSRRECLGRGQYETCQRGQKMSCQTEIRYSAEPGRLPIIFKGCKQAMACQSDERQNADQCVEGRKNNVCRCCCSTNRCNSANFRCPTAAQCNLLPAPLHGVKSCKFKKSESEIGTKCRFSCDEGFQLKGWRVSVCRRNGKGAEFNKPPPMCRQRVNDLPIPPPHSSKSPMMTTAALGLRDCGSTPSAPPNGGYSCLRSEDHVVCQYFCGENEKMAGKSVLSCNSVAGWDGSSPECVPECNHPPRNPDNGSGECDGDGGVGTSCDFGCDPGFQLIGEPKIECLLLSEGASWSTLVPFCESRRRIPK